jgi:hypothetical protein
MKLFAVVLGALALLAGFAGGVRAYSVSADAGPPPVRPISMPHYPKAQPVRPGIVFRWAPCRPPAHREGKACVTHVTRTVALPQPAAAPAAQPATTAPAAAAPATTSRVAAHPHTSASSPGGQAEPGDGGGGPEPGDD